MELKEHYDGLLKSGRFWELHPELTGNRKQDEGNFRAYFPFEINHEEEVMRAYANKDNTFDNSRLRELALIEAGKLPNDNLDMLMGRTEEIYQWLLHGKV